MVRSDACRTSTQAVTETSWAECVSGTIPAEDVLSMLRNAGFREVALVRLTAYKTSPSTIGATFRALK